MKCLRIRKKAFFKHSNTLSSANDSLSVKLHIELHRTKVNTKLITLTDRKQIVKELSGFTYTLNVVVVLEILFHVTFFNNYIFVGFFSK